MPCIINAIFFRLDISQMKMSQSRNPQSWHENLVQAVRPYLLRRQLFDPLLVVGTNRTIPIQP